MTPKTKFLAASVVAALGLTGCGINTPTTAVPQSSSPGAGAAASTYQQMVEKAKAEGTLTIYSTDTEEHLLAVIKKFKAKYSISVEYVRLASSAVAQRYASERHAGVVAADIIQLTDPTLIEANPSWFVPLADTQIRSLDGYLPNYKSKYHAAGVVFPSGLQYNTDLVAPNEVPKTYQDLLSPRFKGKILFIDPKASPTPMSLLNLLDKKYGDDFVKKLGAQNLGFVDSASPGAQQIAAGAFEINFPTAGGAQTAPVKAAGAPINYIVLQPVQVGTNELALSAGSDHPNAAALFLDFRFSKAAFEAICATNPEYGLPIDAKIAGCIDMPQDVTKINFQLWADDAAKNRLLDLLGH